MKWSKRLFTRRRRTRIILAAAAISVLVSSCGTRNPHNGRFPFSLMEKPPRTFSEGKMTVVLGHLQRDGAPPANKLASIRAGDVIVFHMSHAETWSYLRKSTIQKIPYELFRYGHIALVVPDPTKASPRGEPRLLQVAMKQAVNADSSLDYLNDKSWTLYRPPAGSVDVGKLHEFAKRAVVTAADPKRAYDYRGAFGVRNAPCKPETLEGIGSTYSCATLVVAGLHYAGYPLDALHHNGRFDIVTPRQVVESARKISTR